MRIRNLANGGVMSVDDDLAAVMLRQGWVSADEAGKAPKRAPQRRPRKAAVKEAD